MNSPARRASTVGNYNPGQVATELGAQEHGKLVFQLCSGDDFLQFRFAEEPFYVDGSRFSILTAQHHCPHVYAGGRQDVLSQLGCRAAQKMFNLALAYQSTKSKINTIACSVVFIG